MSSSSRPCPNCSTPNRIDARYCIKCGRPLIAPMTPAVPTSPVADQPKGSGILNKLRQVVQEILPGSEPAPSPPTTLSGGYLQPQATYSFDQPIHGHDRYYLAKNQTSQFFLMYEAATPLDDVERIRRLAVLVGGLANVCPLRDVIRAPDGRVYLAVDPPTKKGWHFLSDPRDQLLSPQQTVGYGLQLGRALAGLHRGGYTLNARQEQAALEKVVLDGDTATLVDLSTCVPLSEDEAQKRQAVLGDIYFVARVLYWMVAGRNLSRDVQDMGRVARLPRPLRVAITWGAKGSYVSMPEMLTHLSGRNLPPLRLTSGKATHPGRLRDHNEDQFFVYEIAKGRSDQPLPAFYMVADGLGGHEAGEVASDTISTALKAWLDEFSNRKSGRATQRLGEQPDDALRTAIQGANEAVFNQARRRGNNMGATVTAVLIVGEQAFIANVGDSRTYLLRGGELRALTVDHSLVYSLYRSNQISLDEIYTHPNRNQIYRSLGEKPNVEVDIFTETLEPGDMLLLCSDGLWEMVRDPQLTDILQRARTPQEAADRLIDRANRNGGEDNITAVIVRVE